ncbi:MAG: EAL domain-containing protein [Pseudomonadota bacterium]
MAKRSVLENLGLPEGVQSDALLETLNNLAEGVYRTSLDDKKLWANNALVAMNRFERLEDFLDAPIDPINGWYVEPGRRAQFVQSITRDGAVHGFVSQVKRRGNGELIWVEENARLIRDPDTGVPLYYEGSVRDVTSDVERENRTRRFIKLADQVPGGLFVLKRQKGGRYTAPFLSAGFTKLSGISDIGPQSDLSELISVVHPNDLEAMLATNKKSGMEMIDWSCELRIWPEMEEEKWVQISAKPERAGEDIEWFGYCFDVSDRKANEMRIEQLAYYDGLTGLPNRRHTANRMQQALANQKRNGVFGGVLYIDLDNFKTLNDTHGHDKGDQLLVSISSALKVDLRQNDIVGRLGGDEFVVVCEQLDTDRENAAQKLEGVGKKLLAVLAQPFDLGDVKHHATCSIGASLFNNDDDDENEVLKRADLAMYTAKRSGRNTIVGFVPSMMSAEQEEYQLIQGLQTAMDLGEVDLGFQPQMDQYGRVCGAETLLRWKHAEFGRVAPGTLIETLERSGKVNDITAWTIESVLGVLCEWEDNPILRRIGLSVNVSSSALLDRSLVAEVRRMVRSNKTRGSRLTLEVNESVFVENATLVKGHMTVLTDLGVRFSIDDFGTGFSPLRHLRELKLSELKIDGSFVRSVTQSNVDKALVASMLTTAEIMGLRAVAQRVETEEQLNVLRELGCSVFQGHHFSEAVPRNLFEAMVAGHASEFGDDDRHQLA